MTAIHTKAARSTDPITSHLAGEEVTKSGRRAKQQNAVFDLVTYNPGHTASELSEFSNLDRYQIQRRLSDMDGVRVRKGEPHECKVTGRLAVTWWPI